MDTMGKAKRDYIAGRGSYRALAEKYHIPLRTMADRAKAEKWVELREQARNKAVMQSVDAIAKRNAEVDVSIYDAADALLEKIMELAKGQLSTRSIKELTGALRDIKDIKNLRSALDMQEQEARIEKLRREAQRQDADSDTQIVVTVEDGGMGYGE